MAFDMVSALKMLALTSSGPEVRGLMQRASDELMVLKLLRFAVRDCVRAEGDEEKRVAWKRVKELCQVSESE